MSRVLHLNLYGYIFRQVLDGSKKTEFRTKSKHWLTRLAGEKGASYDIVRFRNGYSKEAPSLDIVIEGIDCESGDEIEIYLGEILATSNLHNLK